jgi:putative hydrolase of the HAD superfamily
MGNVAAVLFDMDDTLTDWPAAIARAIEHVLPRVPAEHQDGLRERIWPAIEEISFVWREGIVGDRAYWKLLFTPEEAWTRVLPGVPHDEVALVAQEFREHVRPDLFDDVVPTLDGLRGRVPLGLLSNNPYASRVLDRLGLRDRFDNVLSVEEQHPKPHPEAFARACEAMGTAPGATVYVGDSYDNDLVGASEAGLIAVWLDRVPFDYERPAGSHRIGSLWELPALLDYIRGAGGA